MTKKRRLRNQATQCASRRGHALARWRHAVEFWGDKYSVSYCTICGAHVQTNQRPAPNEIDIAGEAVATQCPGHPMPSWMSMDVRVLFGMDHKTARQWRSEGR